MKEQQKRKIQQFHPEIEDGIDLRRSPQEKIINGQMLKPLLHGKFDQCQHDPTEPFIIVSMPRQYQEEGNSSNIVFC